MNIFSARYAIRAFCAIAGVSFLSRVHFFFVFVFYFIFFALLQLHPR